MIHEVIKKIESISERASDIAKRAINGPLSPEDTQFVESEWHPTIESLMDKRFYYDVEEQLLSNRFVQRTLDFYIIHLERDYLPALKVGQAVLDYNREYYNTTNYTLPKLAAAAKLQMEEIIAEKNGTKVEEEWDASDGESKYDYARMSRILPLYSLNLEYFGRKGGFEAIRRALESNVGFDILLTLMETIYKLKSYLRDEYLKPLLKGLMKPMAALASRLSEEDVKTKTKKDYSELLNKVEYTLIHLERADSRRAVEKLEFGVIMKCIQSQFLEKRIYAIDELILKINDFIAAARRRTTNAADTSAYYSAYELELQRAQEESLAKFIKRLRKFDIFQILFGENSHPELVRRGGAIVRFLYNQKMIGPAEIEAIYRASKEKHEEERRVTNKVLCEVVTALEPRDMAAFFRTVATDYAHSLDQEFFKLVKAITQNALFATLRQPTRPTLILSSAKEDDELVDVNGAEETLENVEKWNVGDVEGSPKIVSEAPPQEEVNRVEKEKVQMAPLVAELWLTNDEVVAALMTEILGFLWTVLADALEETLSNNLFMQVLSIFVDFLVGKAPSHLMTYLQQVIGLVRARRAGRRVLTILKALLRRALEESRSARSEATTAMLGFVDRDFFLLNEVCFAFLARKRDLAELLLKEETAPPGLRNDGAAAAALQEFAADATGFLEFVAFLHKEAHVELDARHIRLLWEALFTNALSEEEHQQVFEFLRALLPEKPAEMVGQKEELVQLVFFELLLRLDFTELNEVGFACFEAYFKLVNEGFAAHVGVAAPAEDGEEEEGHIGLEGLWDIFLSAARTEVSARASRLLIRIIEGQFEEAPSSAVPTVYARFVEKIMREIEHALAALRVASEGAAAVETRRISRCLDIIVQLVEEVDLKAPRGKGGDGEVIELQIDNKVSNSSLKKFSQVVFRSMTVLDLKKVVAERINAPVPFNELMLITRGSILNEEHRSIEDLRIESGQTVMCIQQPAHDDIEAQPRAPAPEVPSALASQIPQEHIEHLRGIFPDVEDDLVRFILEKKGGDLQDAALLLSDESLVTDYRRFFATERGRPPTKTATEAPRGAETKAIGAQIEQPRLKLSQLLAASLATFETLFELTSLSHAELSPKAWALLNMLPVNGQLQESIKAMRTLDDEALSWATVFDTRCPFKLLYYLQIVASLTNCLILEDKDRLAERAAWRARFLESDAFVHLIAALRAMATRPFAPTAEFAAVETKCLATMIHIVKVFVFAALLAEAPPEALPILRELMDYRDLDSASAHPGQADVDAPRAALRLPPPGQRTNHFRASASNSVSNSSNMTPNFHSPNTSRSASPHSTTPHVVSDREADAVSLAKSSLFAKEKDAAPQLDEFLYLVRTNGHAFWAALREVLDLADFLRQLLDFLPRLGARALTADEHLAGFLEGLFDLLTGTMVFSPAYTAHLFADPRVSASIVRLLVACERESVRRKVAGLVLHLCGHGPTKTFGATDFVSEKSHSVAGRLLSLLLPALDELELQATRHDDYVLCLAEVLRACPRDELCDLVNLASLLEKVTRIVQTRPFIEDCNSDGEDALLSGLFVLTRHLLELEPQLLRAAGAPLVHLLYDTLFGVKFDDPNVLNYPKAKRRLTRRRGLDLLVFLAQREETAYSALLPLLAKNHARVELKEVEVTAPVDVKNALGYVGLKNLGATCYINSLLQQFYMIKPLRHSLLHTELPLTVPRPAAGEITKHLSEPIEEQPAAGEEPVRAVFDPEADLERLRGEVPGLDTALDSNVLYQLKSVFAQLQEGVKSHHIPRSFVTALKGFDGQPINVTVQQDVDEFYSLLCDRLETCLKGTRNADLLRSQIGGTLSNEIISLEEEFPFYSEREEPYLTLALDIKNKRTIQEALDLYVKGDILDGENKYLCEQYGRKLKVQKRCCIKTLPDTLVVTLKRFEFDFTAMTKVKLNDYFEFPMTLNLRAWTKAGLREEERARNQDEDGLPLPPSGEEHGDSYYEYELVGVLVHSGTSEAGHYYSFIKDRDSAQWFEFNDTLVKRFDLRNLRTECFGGDFERGDFLSEWYSPHDKSSRNAYILLYERPKPHVSRGLVAGAPPTMPRAVFDRIWNENIEFLRNRLFCDVDYFAFVREFCAIQAFAGAPESLPSFTPLLSYSREMLAKADRAGEKGSLIDIEEEPATQGLRLAVVVAFETLIKFKDFHTFVHWIQTIRSSLERYIPGNFWFLTFLQENVLFIFPC